MPRVERHGRQAAGREVEYGRQHPDQERPLVHFRRQEGAERHPGLPVEREHGGDDELRRLRGERRDPLHQQELLDAPTPAEGQQPDGEGLRREADGRAGVEEERRDGQAPRPGGQRPERLGRALELGLARLAVHGTPSIEEEQCAEAGGVEDGKACLQRDDESVERRPQERNKLHRVLVVQPDGPAPMAPPGGREDRRPAHADEQAVGAGHVRRGEGDEARVAPALPGEDHVHRVFGKHGEQGYEPDRDALRDVHLRGLGRPAEQERRAHHAGGGAGDAPRRVGSRQPRGEPRRAGPRRQGEEEEIAGHCQMSLQAFSQDFLLYQYLLTGSIPRTSQKP